MPALPALSAVDQLVAGALRRSGAMRAATALLLRRTEPSLVHWARRLATVQPVTATAAAELAGAGPSGYTAAAAASSPAAAASLTDRYHQLVAAGTLQHDPAQEHCVRRLDRLSGELKAS